MAPPRRASDNRLEQLQELADAIAAMRTDDEIQDGMSGDDAAETIGSLVTWARRLSDRRPDPSTVYVHPDVAEPFTPDPERPFDSTWRHIHAKAVDGDAYPFAAPSYPNMVPCGPCQGTGEVIDFPTETDERMVCCPNCGGQGEVPAS